VLRTFTSSAVRVVQAALKGGLDISGCTIFTGGEPLTEERYRFIKSAAVNVFPRYVATETGLIAGPCSRSRSADDMHVYLDRLAVIPGSADDSLLFTTLLPSTGKILLNTALGDSGHLERRSCGCPLGELGMDLHVSGVSSAAKLTGEGMSVMVRELDQIVGAIVSACGGCPDDYQFWQATHPETGLSELTVVVDPALEGLDEDSFTTTVLTRLRQGNPRERLASELWRQSDMFNLVRRPPKVSDGRKQLLLIENPERRR
jgi:phenylacetate-coenzyme A ligase PaaK-like adenylate-forming protein